MIIIKITIDDNRYIILESREKNLEKIEKLFTYNDMSECFEGGKFKKENIKKRKLLTIDPKNPTMALLPIGFLQELEEWLINKEAKYKIYDNRKIKEYSFTDDEIRNCLGYLTLDDFQVDAIKTILEKKVGVVKCPTGAGKCVTGDAEIEIEYDDEEIQL